MGMTAFKDKVVIMFGREYGACGFISENCEPCGPRSFYLREREGYFLDGVRLETRVGEDGGGGILYVPVSTVKVFFNGRPIETEYALGNIGPGCSVFDENMTLGMKAIKIERYRGGAGQNLDHLKLTLA